MLKLIQLNKDDQSPAIHIFSGANKLTINSPVSSNGLGTLATPLYYFQKTGLAANI